MDEITAQHEKRAEERKDLACYLLDGGLRGRKFVARSILAGDGTFEFDHRKGIPREGRDVYEVVEIKRRQHLGVQEPLNHYCGAFVITSRGNLTFLVDLTEHLYDLEATQEEIQQAQKNRVLLTKQ